MKSIIRGNYFGLQKLKVNLSLVCFILKFIFFILCSRAQIFGNGEKGSVRVQLKF